MSIVLQDVGFTYGVGSGEEKQALQAVNFEIHENEFLAVVGHTGSGKSTLIQLLNGLEKPTTGKVLFHGQDIWEKSFPLKTLRSKVGLVFQYPEHQLFEATVEKDVEFGPRNMGWEQLKVEMNAFQALKDVGISDDLYDVSPLALSGGQKRRVAIAGVLAMEPEILVLDEPMAGLDPAGRTEIFDLLCRLHRDRKIAIVLVSHSMDDVGRYAERVVVMNQGKIVLDGAPEQVFQYADELRSIGLGVPQAAGLMQRLAAQGAPVRTNCLTVSDSVEAVTQWLSKR